MTSVLITGASGYLGKAIVSSGRFAQLTSLSRTGDGIKCDLENSIPKLGDYDMVIHAAGKAHSRPHTPQEKESFFTVNVGGTENLLRALSAGTVPHTFIFISSVAVYGAETGSAISEKAPLNANDPYGESKIRAEHLVQEWCKQHHVKGVILRLPLIVGANPPGNLGSMIRAIKGGYYFNIAGGTAKRSGVLLNDLVAFLPGLYGREGIFNLTDGADFSYNQLGRVIARQIKGKPPKNIPLFVASVLAAGGNMMGSKAPFNSYALKKMTSDLTFDSAKAVELLQWQPRIVLRDFSLV